MAFLHNSVNETSLRRLTALVKENGVEHGYTTREKSSFQTRLQ